MSVYPFFAFVSNLLPQNNQELLVEEDPKPWECSRCHLLCWDLEMIDAEKICGTCRKHFRGAS